MAQGILYGMKPESVARQAIGAELGVGAIDKKYTTPEQSATLSALSKSVADLPKEKGASRSEFVTDPRKKKKKKKQQLPTEKVDWGSAMGTALQALGKMEQPETRAPQIGAPGGGNSFNPGAYQQMLAGQLQSAMAPQATAQQNVLGALGGLS